MGRCYPHLNLEERRKLAKWLDAKIPVKEIADNLQRAPSTIYREIRRNYYSDTELPQLNGYHAVNAQDQYEKRRAVHRKLIRHPELMAAVRDGFGAGWSPEQIAGRMKLERHPMRVSHETIYRYAYSKDGRAEKFYRHLPEHRRRRRARGTRKHHGRRFLDELAMEYRPEVIAVTKAELPDAEGIREELASRCDNKKIHLISAVTGVGLREMLYAVNELLLQPQE